MKVGAHETISPRMATTVRNGCQLVRNTVTNPMKSRVSERVSFVHIDIVLVAISQDLFHLQRKEKCKRNEAERMRTV